MITVFGRRNSSSVQMVMWAVYELGLQHDRLDYGHGHASTQTPEFLSMNPMGRVPVLIDGDMALFESAAILRYLGARYGSAEFWPREAQHLARLDSWAEWGKNTFADAVLRVFVYDVRTLPENRDPKVLEQATAHLIPLARMMDRRVKNNQWLDGDRFTFADIACGHILHRYHALNWSRPELPDLLAYYERLQSRPAYRNHAMVSYEDLRGSY